MKDKVQYACRMFNSAGDRNEPNQSKLPHKRPNAHIYRSEYDSDSSAVTPYQVESLHSSSSASKQESQPQSHQPTQQFVTVIQDAQENLQYIPILVEPPFQLPASTAPDQSQFVFSSDQFKFGLDNYNIASASNEYVISVGPNATDALSNDEENRNQLIIINDKDANKEDTVLKSAKKKNTNHNL